MRLLIAAVIGTIVLAAVFHEDIARYWAQHGPQISSTGTGGGAGRLGDGSRRTFGGVGRSAGGR